MKTLLLRHFYLLAFLAMGVIINAQNKNAESKNHPATFRISKTDFDALFTNEPGQTIRSENSYLNNSKVAMNSRNGDILFLRLELASMPLADLLIQVNGGYSTQIFILSRDKSVFYKGQVNNDHVLMTKCSEDEIVSE